MSVSNPENISTSSQPPVQQAPSTTKSCCAGRTFTKLNKMSCVAYAGVAMTAIYGVACFSDPCAWGDVDACPGNCSPGFNIPATIFGSISLITAVTTTALSLAFERYGPLC